jgi:hypothetical protein
VSAPLPVEPSREYLAAAREAGLIHRIGAAECVLGAATGARGQQDCLVEYCPPSVWSSRATMAQLAAVARELLGPVERMILRVPGTERPAGGPTPVVSYLWRADRPATDESSGQVSRADADDDRQVARWLTEALRGGYDDLAEPADPQVLAGAVEQLMGDPSRVSFVAPATGGVQGHATLLVDAEDELTGARYVELVDVLVEPGELQRTLRTLLTDAAVRYAADLGSPIVGNVSHGAAGTAAGQRSWEVLAQLGRAGWQNWYTLWARPL